MNDKPTKRPTSFDVAQRAGVHRSVVSRALSGTGRMSQDTRSKVLRAAEELGYRVNFLARGLQNQSSGLVGLLASRLDTPYRAQQVRVAARELLQSGYCPILITAEENDDLSGLLERLLSYSVAGMIVTSDTPPGGIIEECHRMSLPVVLINRDPSVTGVDRVQIDIDSAGRMAFDMLRQRGGRHFAVLRPLDQTYTVAGRADAFARYCREAGCPFEVIQPDGQDYADGLQAAAQFAALPQHVDAVFGTTDLLALGFLDGLRSRQGIAVPEAVQLVGFDDIAQAGWLGYDLSTIRQDVDQAAHAAVRLLLNRIANPGPEHATTTIQLSPVHRGTTRKVQKQ